MIQVFQKSLLRGAAERLNAQRPGCRLLGCDRRGSVGPHILSQFIQIIFPFLLVQTFQMLPAGKDDQLVSGPRRCHIDQLLVVFQPLVGACLGLLRDRRGKKNHVFLVPLKGMNRPAGHIVHFRPGQRFLDQLLLVDKGCNDTDIFILVQRGISGNLTGLRRRRILKLREGILHIQINKGLFFPALGQDVEFGMIILTVVKPDDILMAPVMVVQKRLITDRVTGQIRLIDRIFPVVIFIGNRITLPQFIVGQLIQQNHRIELLRVAYQHQARPPQDGHQRNRNIALTGLVHDHHIKHRLRLSETMGRNAGGGDDRKDLLQL